MEKGKAMGIPTSTSRGGVGLRLGPAPYLVVGLAWFAFLMVALRVPMIEPVFLWVMTQGLLVERVVPLEGGWWISRALLLFVYMGAGLLAWWLLERPGFDPRRVWLRAALAWVGIQLAYALSATILVLAGILSE